MPLHSLIQHYKGGLGSGDWGHRGRPGKRGGSGGGGGKFVIASPNYMKGHSPKCPEGSDSDNKVGCRELRQYTGGEHKDINNRLRGFAKKIHPDRLDYVDRTIDSMDRMFNDAKPLEKTITVRRGLSEGILDKLQEGDTFQDTGFVSTTIHSTLVGAGIIGSKAFMEIKVPKGTRGLYLENLSQFPREKEFLLDRNSKFVVDKISQKPSGAFVYNVSLMKK